MNFARGEVQGECQWSQVMRKWLRGKGKAEKMECEVEHRRFGVTESWRAECDGGLAEQVR